MSGPVFVSLEVPVDVDDLVRQVNARIMERVEARGDCDVSDAVISEIQTRIAIEIGSIAGRVRDKIEAEITKHVRAVVTAEIVRTEAMKALRAATRAAVKEAAKGARS